MSNNSTTDEKARELEERARNFYNKLAKDYEDDLEPDETFEFAAAFAESERSSAIKEAREECARAICEGCHLGLPLTTDGELQVCHLVLMHKKWVYTLHSNSFTKILKPCNAAAIHALGEKI